MEGSALWFRAGGPWTGLGTTLGWGRLCTLPGTMPPIFVHGTDEVQMGKHSENALLTLFGSWQPSQWDRGSFQDDPAVGWCQISGEVIFTLGGGGRQVMFRLFSRMG